ncbi:MAG: helix-turn-helix domain-containing protein, partial [Roseburia sp.]|nr:helix-turn-helix domain-containing protein [Roseburia sp.]
MTKEEIGNKLKQARVSSGMTQKEVAEKIGRTQQIVGHWESGYSQPDADTLFTLCDIYGVSIDDTFGFNRNKVNISDLKFLERYHSLDQHGRETVNYIMDREAERMKQVESAT